MRIILSTRNPSKLEQIKAIFANSPISILTLNSVGIIEEATEDGKTLQDNALKPPFGLGQFPRLQATTSV